MPQTTTYPWDHGPVEASSNGRYLQHHDGTPFFVLGDTAWEMADRSTREEVVTFMEDRAAKKFNMVLVVCYAELGNPGHPNAYGNCPCINGKASAPNPLYFEHVDFIIDSAARYGLYIGLLPAWGSWIEQGLLDPETMDTYAAWLGTRYRGKPNLVWILGGDRHYPGHAVQTVWHRCARGIAVGVNGREDYRGLCISLHPRARSSHAFHHAPWLTFNMMQSAHWKDRNMQTENGLLWDYFLQPAKPCMDAEPVYEEIPFRFWTYPSGTDPLQLERCTAYYVRKPRYTAILSGGCGTVYGCNNIWQWYSDKERPTIFANRPWHDSLDLEGARQMQLLRAVFEQRPWYKLIPSTDWFNSIVLTGLDSEDHGHIAAATSSDRSFALVYSGEGNQFTVATNGVDGPGWNAWWFDPRTGAVIEAGSGATSSAGHVFAAPTKGVGHDWLLILDSAGAKLPPPAVR